MPFFPIFAAEFRSSTMKTVILSLILIAAAVLLLGVKVLFVKGGEFPSGHVHNNPGLKKRGISCASSDTGATVQKANNKNNRIYHT